MLLGLFVTNDTVLYIENEDPDTPKIEYVIKVNGEEVFQDSVAYALHFGEQEKASFDWGINNIEVWAYDRRVYNKRRFVTLWSNYIVVSNLPECGEEEKCIHIDFRFTPYSSEWDMSRTN